MRERCIQQMLDHVAEFPSPTAAPDVISKRSGVDRETWRSWYLQAKVIGGLRGGATTVDLADSKALKAKVRRLEDDNNFLR